jgi:hypothetical protein
MVSVKERGVAMTALVVVGGRSREVEVEEEVVAMAALLAAAAFWAK